MNFQNKEPELLSKRKRVMSIEGVLSVITDQILSENKSKLKKRCRNPKYYNSGYQSDSSIEIVPKSSPCNINKKIKVTEKQLTHFIEKHFTVINDNESLPILEVINLDKQLKRKTSLSELSSSSEQ